MPEVHLKQPGFTKMLPDYLLITKKDLKKIKGTRDSGYIY